MLYHIFTGIINAIDDKMNPMIKSFLKSEYIKPCIINVMGNNKNNPSNIFLSALLKKVIASIIILGNIIDKNFFINLNSINIHLTSLINAYSLYFNFTVSTNQCLESISPPLKS